MTLPETLPVTLPTRGLEDLLKDLKHSSLTMPQQAILFALARQVEAASKWDPLWDLGELCRWTS